jgi:hypothetical protein
VWNLSGVVIDAGTSALYFGTCAETAVEVNNSITEVSAVLNWVLMSDMALLSTFVFLLRALAAGKAANACDKLRGEAPSALIALLGCSFRRKPASGLREWPTHAYVQYEKA